LKKENKINNESNAPNSLIYLKEIERRPSKVQRRNEKDLKIQIKS